jgi:polysaccharide biosynthesis/export protein
MVKFGSLFIAALALSGCSVLPASGPQSLAVYEGVTDAVYSTEADKVPYAIVDITPEIIRHIPTSPKQAFAGRFTDRSPAPTLTLGAGDVVAISIFEASSGGLFIPSEAGARSGNFVQLPAQEVDRQGNISIPYGGVIPAAGRTPQQVKELIEKSLRNRAIEPQAVVSVTERRSAMVTLLGDLGAQKLSINPLGERVLDVIARAGGTKYPGYEMYVTLQRDNQKATVTFNRLFDSPQDNIFVRPRDTIYVYRLAPTFLVFGAASTQGQVLFEKEHLTMAEAMAKVGGMIDTRSDPDAVFVFRMEDTETAKKLGLDVAKLSNQNRVPVIYRAKLREPSGLFVTSSFRMRDRDIIYVANSYSVEWLKFVSFVNSNISFAENVASVPNIGKTAGSTTVIRTTTSQ